MGGRIKDQSLDNPVFVPFFPVNYLWTSEVHRKQEQLLLDWDLCPMSDPGLPCPATAILKAHGLTNIYNVYTVFQQSPKETFLLL